MSSLEPLPEDVTDDAEPLSSNFEPQTELKASAREGLPFDHSGQSTQNKDQRCNIPDINSGAIYSRAKGNCADLLGLDQKKSKILQPQECLKEDYVSDTEVESYQDRFPDHLRSDFHDAMIVYHDEDYAEANSFLNKIESEVNLSNGEKPRVELYDLMGPETGCKLRQLEHNLRHCRYVFLYITDIFLKDPVTRFQNNTCLWDSITSSEQKFQYVPVLTDCKQKVRGVLPSSIANLKSVDLWSGEKMMRYLKRLLEDALKFRRKKEKELQNSRKIWIMEEKEREKCENVGVPRRSEGNSQDPALPVAVDRTRQEEGASSFPASLEGLSESCDIKENLTPASQLFSSNKQRLQQSSLRKMEVSDKSASITHVESVPIGQGVSQGPGLSCLPSQLPGNRIASPSLHLGQQNLCPESPVREVHHHYYLDPSHSHLPLIINIKNAENIMIGEKIHITHKSDGHMEHEQTQESPTDQLSSRDILETAERPFQETGQRELPELDLRGPSLVGSSLDSLLLSSPSSGLTGQVTTDQICSQSPVPSPDLPKQPSRKTPQYGFPDLISTPNTGGGSSKYPPPSPDESTPGVLVRPVAVTKPFNPAAEEQQWRRQYDTEPKTAVKRLSGCGEESREDLSDNDGENDRTNVETMVKLRTP